MEGRPCTSWLDGVKKACNTRALELSDAKVKCMDRDQWRDFVNYKLRYECIDYDSDYFEYETVKELDFNVALTASREGWQYGCCWTTTWASR